MSKVDDIMAAAGTCAETSVKDASRATLRDLKRFEGHTAGPWRVGTDLRYVTLGAGRISRNGMAVSVCKLTENSVIRTDEHMPNAELIAAAPDLLAEVIRLRAALAAAIADARSYGAMEAQQRMFPCCGGNDESPAEHCMDCETRAISLPAGPRKAVRLTDWQLAAAMSEIQPGDELASGFSFLSWQSGRPDAASALDEARLVQVAVLAANGMGNGNAE